MKIAAVQMVSTPSVERNLDAARRAHRRAPPREGAALVVLPEYFCFMGRSDRDKLAVAEAPGEGPIQRMLAETAREHGVWLIGGTLPLRVGGARTAAIACSTPTSSSRRAASWSRATTRSTCSRYDNGRERYDEARTLQAGPRRRSRSTPAGCASA